MSSVVQTGQGARRSARVQAMTYDVSLPTTNEWVIGIDFLAKWSTKDIK